jgi:hypothetical protein
MIRHTTVFLFAFIFATQSSASANEVSETPISQQVLIFGLPLGGPISQPKSCEVDIVNSEMCLRFKGATSSNLWHFIELKPNSAPDWVAPGSTSIVISEKNILQEIAVFLKGTLVSKKHTDAVASISARFGAPTAKGYFNGRGYASWVIPNLIIFSYFDIYNDSGAVSFKTPEWSNLLKKRDAALIKPVTP